MTAFRNKISQEDRQFMKYEWT